MKIIQASMEHIEGLALLFDAYRVWYRKDSNIPAAKEFLKARLQNSESIVYLAIDEKNGGMVGFTQLYPLFSSTRMKPLWLLNDLFVQPDYRGQGISKLLIDRCKELARTTEAAGLMLETEKSNTIGNQLYAATDFELESDVNFYFWKTN